MGSYTRLDPIATTWKEANNSRLLSAELQHRPHCNHGASDPLARYRSTTMQGRYSSTCKAPNQIIRYFICFCARSTQAQKQFTSWQLKAAKTRHALPQFQEAGHWHTACTAKGPETYTLIRFSGRWGPQNGRVLQLKRSCFVIKTVVFCN